LSNFNTIAPVYDLLSQLVFFGSIQKAQISFVEQIAGDDRILILGGGSGLILKALEALHRPISVDFVEPSTRMIAKAKKQAQNRVDFQINFYQLPFADFEVVHDYDWVFCGFFLDVFSETNLHKAIDKISNTMNNQTKLVVSDFQISNNGNRYWQRPFSKIMHSFFGVFAKLESKSLLNIHRHLCQAQLGRQERKTFYADFIFSTIYRKNACQNNFKPLGNLRQ